MDPLLVLFGVFVAVVSAIARFVHLAWRYGRPFPVRESSRPCKTVVVMGAGGHGAEMMQLLSGLKQDLYSPRIYVVAKSDEMSRKKVERFESTQKLITFWAIMRAREVGQSYITSVFTTILALIHSLPLLFLSRPDLVLCNGPGTCVPVCLAAYLVKYLGLKSTRIVYVESICRTRDLSLSGKILYHLFVADDVIVQWPQLVDSYPRTRYLGRLI